MRALFRKPVDLLHHPFTPLLARSNITRQTDCCNCMMIAGCGSDSILAGILTLAVMNTDTGVFVLTARAGCGLGAGWADHMLRPGQPDPEHNDPTQWF